MNLPQAATSPWPEILHLVQQKVSYQGKPVVGDPEKLKGFANWLMQQLPAVVGNGDADHRANMLLLWLRSEPAYEADSATRMKAQASVVQAPINPISHQTVPQQAQMAPPVPQPVAAAVETPETGPGLVCPKCQTKASGIRGMKRHVTMSHQTEWAAFCTEVGVDQKTFAPVGIPQPVAAPVAVPAPPVAAPVPPMFQATGPAEAFVAPAPPQMPMAMPVPQAVVPAAASMPMTGMAIAPQAIPTHAPPAPPMVAFDPSVIQPGLPGQQAIPFAAQPVPVAVQTGAPSREDLARMLGGPVDLVMIRLLDAAVFPLQGRADVNQLAAVAEAKARAEMKVTDLAQSAYGQGKQAAQRHFAELLTQAPGCYLLLNGYEPMIPSGYLEILAARVVKFHIITDNGQKHTTVF